jgi:RNA polymerase sigma-70 factor (ECF subfamily)
MVKEASNPSDYDIVLSCLNGNRDDFAILVDRYKALVYSILYRMTNNSHDYADIAQDIFVKVYKSLDKYSPEYRFSTWLIRITTNHVIDLRRKKLIDTTSLEDSELAMASSRSAEEEYLSAEYMRELNEQIQALPEMYRLPLILYHKHGMSYLDIADSLKLPLSKVKNRIYRARVLLKSALSEADRKEGE